MRSGRVRVHSNVDVDAFGIDTVSTPSRCRFDFDAVCISTVPSPSRWYENCTNTTHIHSDADRCSIKQNNIICIHSDADRCSIQQHNILCTHNDADYIRSSTHGNTFVTTLNTPPPHP
jgi:hypothetical protein